MSTNMYTLEPYKGMSSRYTCPSCNKSKAFSRYINVTNEKYLDENVGRCNREINCGYHYSPKQYFLRNLSHEFKNKYVHVNSKDSVKPASFIPIALFKASLREYENNYFARFLCELFGAEISYKLINSYFIGTSKYWLGATIFWQVDFKGMIRTGKVMLYNSDVGKRIKKPYDHINWIHALKNKDKTPIFPNYNLNQCLFGEHLLRQNPSKPVAIVESEKTAIIASVYLPQFNWLACGGKGGLNEEKCKVLEGRKVVLYPDLNCFDQWSEKAKRLSHITNFTISDLLERKATNQEKERGLDLADFLMRFSLEEFIKSD